MSSLAEVDAQIFEEFKKRVKDFLPDDLLGDELFLSRWLIARDFCIEKAVIMLKDYMEWRKDNSISELLNWKPPEDLKAACPYEICGTDLEGRPVLIFPYARWTPWKFTENDRRAEYLKYMNQMIEKCVAAVRPPCTQFMILADSEGFSFRHMTRLNAFEANLEALRGFEVHYPEMLGRAFAINCPKVFSVLYNLIRPLMSQHTQSKLRIFDSNSVKWKEQLAKYISIEQLPKKYGGCVSTVSTLEQKRNISESLELTKISR